MIRIAFLFLSLQGFNFAHAGEGQTVYVRLKKHLSVGEISGMGLKIMVQAAEALGGDSPKLRRARVKLLSLKGRWPKWQVRFDDEAKPITLLSRRLYVVGELLRVGLQPAPRTLEIVPAGESQMDVLASLDIEKYLTGVLPSEMPAHWPMEALKAQAVASRSYALALLRERKSVPFQLEATVLDQVFNIGQHVEATPSIRAKVAQAVRETTGEVLLDERGQVIKAFYHSDCGGQTEWARKVWGEKRFEGGVTKDSHCPLNPLGKWRYQLSKAALGRIFLEHFHLSRALSFESVAIAGRTASGRVNKLQVVFSDKIAREIPSQEFRRLVGYDRLRSTNFQIQWMGEDLIISGLGYGHGVGMCQHGAKALANEGMSYREILAKYYSRAQLNTKSRPKLARQRT